MIGHGTAADEATLPIRVVAKAPTTVDLVTAAAVPLTGLTAFQLIRRLDIQLGETVLVHNASGGVGQFAVLFAQLAGARVIGTASPANHDHLQTLVLANPWRTARGCPRLCGRSPRGASMWSST